MSPCANRITYISVYASGQIRNTFELNGELVQFIKGFTERLGISCGDESRLVSEAEEDDREIELHKTK